VLVNCYDSDIVHALVVLDVIYQVRHIVLSTGRSVLCIWVSLDPQYSVNYSQSFNHTYAMHSASPSAASNSTNHSIQVCFYCICSHVLVSLKITDYSSILCVIVFSVAL